MNAPNISPAVSPVSGFARLSSGLLVATANIKSIELNRRTITITHNDGTTTPLVFGSDASAAANLQYLITQMSGGAGAPTITGISTSNGSFSSNISVPANDDGNTYLQGTNFLPGGTIAIGSQSFNATFISTTVVWAPSGQVGLTLGSGTYDVVYTGPDGQTVTLSGGYTVT